MRKLIKILWIIFIIALVAAITIMNSTDNHFYNTHEKIIILTAVTFFIVFIVLFVVSLGIFLFTKGKFKNVNLKLGTITNFNEVLQKYVDTPDEIKVHALKRSRTFFENWNRGSQARYIYQNINIIVKDHAYTISQIKRFEIIESDSVKKSHEISNLVNGRSIAGAAGYTMALNASRRVMICFSDEKCFIIKKVNHEIAIAIQNAIIDNIA